MSESKSASVVFTNGSLLAKNAQTTADSAKSTAETAQALASGAQKTADGKNSVYRGSDPATVPTANLKSGDIYFTDNALYTWNGSSWEKTVSDITGAEIHAKVENAMQESQKSVADLKADVEAKVKKLDDEIAQNKIQTGNALNFYKEQYYLSTSYTELVGGSWSDEVPGKVKGKYVWSRYVTANIGDSTNYQYSDPVCISGLDGAQGPQGPTGVPGPQGPQGAPSYTHIAYSTSADGKTDFDVSNGTGKTYIGIYCDSNFADSMDPDKYTWSLIKGERGDQGIPGTKGADGQTPYFHIAYANSSDGTINFDVSNSDGKLYIGQYTDYTQADSTNPASYRWAKIKGDTGQTGATGPQGPQGVAGADVYYSIYEMSPSQQGMYLTDLTPVVSQTNLPKIGSHVIAPSGKVYTITATYPNTNPPQYGVGPQLTSIAGPVGPKGDAGDQGIPGPKGDNGQTTYVHFAYANSADGNTNFNTSYFSNALYVGTYTDYAQTDSGDYTKYTWSRLKGDTGSTGFFVGTTPPPNPTTGTVWATTDSSGNMTSAKTWNGSAWVSTAFTQDLVAGNITADKLVGGTLDVNKVTIKNAQNIPVTSTVSLGQKFSNIEQDAKKIKFSMAGQGLDLVDGLGGELVMGFGIPNTTWDGHNACLTLPSTSGQPEVLPQNAPFTNFYAWEAGKTYTQSIVIETDAQIDTSVEPYWTWFTLDGHNSQPAELIDLGNHCYRLIGSYTPDVNAVKNSVRILDIANFNNFVKVNTGTYLRFRSPHFFCADDNSLSELKLTSKSLNAYVKGSNGSSMLAAILSMDPNNSTIGQVVNGHVVAAINTSSDGTVKIDGKSLHITADTKIENAVIKSAMIDSIDASKITTGILNADLVKIQNLTADKIASGTLNGMTITGSRFIANTDNGNLLGKRFDKYQVVVKNTGMNIHSHYSQNDVMTILTSDGLYIQTVTDDNKQGKLIDINNTGPQPYIKLINSGPEAGKYESTYIGSDAIRSNNAQLANWHFTGSKVLAQDGSLYVTNSAGGNFDSGGSVGFQVWGGIGLGYGTIYTPAGDLYIQQGNVGPALGQSYSSAGKVNVHCNKIVSKVANTVSSRLSVKTDITKVTYDRALAAVEGTDMYDYRYVSDDSGQHYVSGIIDDVNAEPQYHMDGMLINKERTARIDANLVGYHHVVIQKLLERVAALEGKAK